MHMREVNLAGVDLNLLPALEALLRRRNVTQAAADVGLSQPAMSRALGRLRDLIGDRLLVRAAGGLALTPQAERIAARLTPALREVRRVFQEPTFDPASAQRVVRVAGVDTQSILYGPAIMARLAREAPGIDLRFVPMTPDIAQRTAAGEIDFAFALANTPLPPGAVTETFADDRLALVMRRGHPYARRRWKLEDYADVSHVGISIFGDGQSELDAALAAQGIKRRIAFVSPHFTAALSVVAATDMVTTVSRAFAARFAEPLGLVLHEPPIANPHMRPALVWNHTRSNDPLHQWLKQVICEAGAAAHAGG